MKVNIGPYKSWTGPYQIANALCFWVPEVADEYGCKSKPEWVHNFGTWLAGTEPKYSLLMRLCCWIDSKRHRVIQVRVDAWDTWSMDSTLALIVLPMLKQLREEFVIIIGSSCTRCVALIPETVQEHQITPL